MATKKSAPEKMIDDLRKMAAQLEAALAPKPKPPETLEEHIQQLLADKEKPGWFRAIRRERRKRMEAAQRGDDSETGADSEGSEGSGESAYRPTPPRRRRMR